MSEIDWYFDFISPFAYLQSTRLRHLATLARVRCKPLLFAGLLSHWEQKGPAELPVKRAWTYEHALWRAHERGIAFAMPRAHPFNPLRLLRLSIALGNDIPTVERLFAFVWRDGNVPTDDDAWAALLAELGADASVVDDAEVKQALRANTDEAIARGVFGVPTSHVDGRNFWGDDSTSMLEAWLAGDPFFRAPAFTRAAALPVGAERPR